MKDVLQNIAKELTSAHLARATDRMDEAIESLYRLIGAGRFITTEDVIDARDAGREEGVAKAHEGLHEVFTHPDDSDLPEAWGQSCFARFRRVTVDSGEIGAPTAVSMWALAPLPDQIGTELLHLVALEQKLAEIAAKYDALQTIAAAIYEEHLEESLSNNVPNVWTNSLIPKKLLDDLKEYVS